MKDHSSHDSGATVLVNGERLHLDTMSLTHLLSQRGIADTRGVAVAINGEMLPHDRWPGCRLENGDMVEIVNAMVGG